MRQSSFNSNTPRLQALTGLRWVAALMVFLYHAAAERLIDDALGGSIFVWATSKAGFVGVSFFFILSGFVLAWTNRKSTRTTTFWLRRIVKIFPNHLVTYAAALTLILCTRPLLPRGSVWSGALPNLLLLQTWVPNPYTFISVNGVSWSLSCELFFYAMFPALLFWIQRIDSRRLWWWALGIAALIGFVPVFAEWLPAGPKLPWKDTPSYPYWFVYVFPPTRALEFALGMIMARIVKERRGPSVRPWLACLLVVCAYVCALGAPYLYGFAAITALPLAILIGSVAHAEQADRVRWLRGRVMVHLGEVSFAFYLVHRLALMYGHMGVGEHVPWGALGGTVFIAATFGVSWLVAFALHRWVEQPVVDWARRVERPRDQDRTSQATHCWRVEMDVLVNGTVVSYAIYGTGPVLVLLHGSNSDGMGTFGRVIDQLGATRTLLVIDYGGCGRSTIPDGDLSLVVLTQQVAAVLRHARTSMVDVLGFSLGAVVAAALAAERPEAVSRLILVAGWATGKDDRHRLVFDTWARLQSIDPNLGQRFALSLLISPEGSEALGPGGLAALAQRPQQANTLRRIELGRDVEIREALSKIRSKSLVVGLSKDYLVPKGGSQALARLIPGSHYKEIDSGHAVLLENPGEFVRMVNEFLREPSGARR